MNSNLPTVQDIFSSKLVKSNGISSII